MDGMVTVPLAGEEEEEEEEEAQMGDCQVKVPQ